MKTLPALLTLLLLIAFTGACKRNRPLPPPPASLPPPSQPAPTPSIEPPTVTPQPEPVPDGKPPVGATTQPLPPPPPPSSPKPAPPRKGRTSTRRSPSTAPAPPPQPPPTALDDTPAAKPESPAKPAQLGEILDAGQRARYAAEIDGSIASARASLKASEGHRLDRSQSEAVARIRGFIEEAAKLKDTDPRTASQLASRAATLGRDLVDSLK